MTMRLLNINNNAVTTFAGPTDIGTAQSRRFYSCAAGAFVDVPGFATGDAAAMASSATRTSGDNPGSLSVTGLFMLGSSGPTSSRPGNPNLRDLHIDTTLSAVVVFDGANWRNPLTGAVA
ncbi:hypothetical protein [Bradyrhizobium ottawaense]|uniref:hypothetical protein n=2 Tax=Nitrobacteraceae TaxID=41294 RepID=UPI0015977292|nr:hypothetical protein [Bradyrhizobium sp. WBAH30]MDD1546185.1 hypothetical protein [Bradyrhizobium sp. WBAH41]MDD1560065.1 hypothetical protein [Bradyrhizobium sp. WBAH23]MDD1567167.1 hypothetical protein [Bradyrhizobium sp. WBAH33]MDD1593475.1 hypothetical protein [Bradyrhizobium sp. WBAH42]NRB90676.1 hypothetical protein [Bradyrhizobium sp. WBAH10]QCJ87102.1 hypothetical protein DAA57_00115 [Bradyrhizobium yuanmingense]